MWTPVQLKQINQALVSAFTLNELRRFTLFVLGVRLEEIVGDVGITDAVFHVVEWARARGLLEELIAKARDERPENEELSQLAEIKPAVTMTPGGEHEAGHGEPGGIPKRQGGFWRAVLNIPLAGKLAAGSAVAVIVSMITLGQVEDGGTHEPTIKMTNTPIEVRPLEVPVEPTLVKEEGVDAGLAPGVATQRGAERKSRPRWLSYASGTPSEFAEAVSTMLKVEPLGSKALPCPVQLRVAWSDSTLIVYGRCNCKETLGTEQSVAVVSAQPGVVPANIGAIVVQRMKSFDWKNQGCP